MGWTSGGGDHIYNYSSERENVYKCENTQGHLKRLLPLLTGTNIFFGLQLLPHYKHQDLLPR